MVCPGILHEESSNYMAYFYRYYNFKSFLLFVWLSHYRMSFEAPSIGAYTVCLNSHKHTIFEMAWHSR